jgi:hypothetical protein
VRLDKTREKDIPEKRVEKYIIGVVPDFLKDPSRSDTSLSDKIPSKELTVDEPWIAAKFFRDDAAPREDATQDCPRGAFTRDGERPDAGIPDEYRISIS